jgi:hypothetical protein
MYSSPINSGFPRATTRGFLPEQDSNDMVKSRSIIQMTALSPVMKDLQVFFNGLLRGSEGLLSPRSTECKLIILMDHWSIMWRYSSFFGTQNRCRSNNHDIILMGRQSSFSFTLVSTSKDNFYRV